MSTPFAHALAAEIARLSLSHHEFAALIGVNQSSISRLVNGGRKPGIDILLALAAHTRLDLHAWLCLAYPEAVRTPTPAAPYAQMLLAYFGQLTPRDQRAVLALTQTLAEKIE